MRLMSYALTAEQVLAQTKTVTRRLGWEFAHVGMIVQPVRKAMGLKKGESIEKLGCPVEFVEVTREPLRSILRQPDEPSREGFPELSCERFLRMFCEHMKCDQDCPVTRIAFVYTVPLDLGIGGALRRTKAGEAVQGWKILMTDRTECGAPIHALSLPTPTRKPGGLYVPGEGDNCRYPTDQTGEQALFRSESDAQRIVRDLQKHHRMGKWLLTVAAWSQLE